MNKTQIKEFQGAIAQMSATDKTKDTFTIKDNFTYFTPESYEPIAFIPEAHVSYGRIGCYQHIGQHSEANLAYYKQTKKATFDEYKELLKELECVYL